MTLTCLGLCKETSLSAYDIARYLMPWLGHVNVTYRAAALSAILNLVHILLKNIDIIYGFRRRYCSSLDNPSILRGFEFYC
jgi:hypothetical protein